MPEKQHESLNKSDFHQDVSQTNGHKVQERQHSLSGASSRKPQWKYQESQDSCNGQKQHHSENRDTDVHFPIHTLRHAIRKHLAQFQCEEKERSIVRNRRHVELITARERKWIVARDECRENIFARSGWKILRH